MVHAAVLPIDQPPPGFASVSPLIQRHPTRCMLGATDVSTVSCRSVGRRHTNSHGRSAICLTDFCVISVMDWRYGWVGIPNGMPSSCSGKPAQRVTPTSWVCSASRGQSGDLRNSVGPPPRASTPQPTAVPGQSVEANGMGHQALFACPRRGRSKPVGWGTRRRKTGDSSLQSPVSSLSSYPTTFFTSGRSLSVASSDIW
jgi:hypothetical protein